MKLETLRATIGIKQICSHVFTSRIGRGNVNYPSRVGTVSLSPIQKLSKSTKSGSKRIDGNSQCETCRRIIEFIFGPSKNTNVAIKGKPADIENANQNHSKETHKTNETITQELQYEVDNKNLVHTNICINREAKLVDNILLATTAKENKEKLTQKIEKIEETPLVEAEKPKLEGFNIEPRVLGESFNSTSPEQSQKIDVVYGYRQDDVADEKYDLIPEYRYALNLQTKLNIEFKYDLNTDDEVLDKESIYQSNMEKVCIVPSGIDQQNHTVKCTLSSNNTKPGLMNITESIDTNKHPKLPNKLVDEDKSKEMQRFVPQVKRETANITLVDEKYKTLHKSSDIVLKTEVIETNVEIDPNRQYDYEIYSAYTTKRSEKEIIQQETNITELKHEKFEHLNVKLLDNEITEDKDLSADRSNLMRFRNIINDNKSDNNSSNTKSGGSKKPKYSILNENDMILDNTKTHYEKVMQIISTRRTMDDNPLHENSFKKKSISHDEDDKNILNNTKIKENIFKHKTDENIKSQYSIHTTDERNTRLSKVDPSRQSPLTLNKKSNIYDMSSTLQRTEHEDKTTDHLEKDQTFSTKNIKMVYGLNIKLPSASLLSKAECNRELKTNTPDINKDGKQTAIQKYLEATKDSKINPATSSKNEKSYKSKQGAIYDKIHRDGNKKEIANPAEDVRKDDKASYAIKDVQSNIKSTEFIAMNCPAKSERKNDENVLSNTNTLTNQGTNPQIDTIGTEEVTIKDQSLNIQTDVKAKLTENKIDAKKRLKADLSCLGPIPKVKEEPLSEMLRKVRERNKVEEEQHNDITEKICGKKCKQTKMECPPKKACPPPPPACPKPCPPTPPPPPPKPCPDPCKPSPPRCPPTKPKCDKFQSCETVNSIFDPHSKSPGVETLTNVSHVLLVRDFEPWTPIPSWPIPKKEKKRPLICPKDGCKVIPPVTPDVKPWKPKHCPGFPKRYWSMPIFLS